MRLSLPAMSLRCKAACLPSFAYIRLGGALSCAERRLCGVTRAFCVTSRTRVRDCSGCGPRSLELHRSPIRRKCAMAYASGSHRLKLARHLVGRALTAPGQWGWEAVWGPGGRLAALDTAQVRSARGV